MPLNWALSASSKLSGAGPCTSAASWSAEVAPPPDQELCCQAVQVQLAPGLMVDCLLSRALPLRRHLSRWTAHLTCRATYTCQGFSKGVRKTALSPVPADPARRVMTRPKPVQQPNNTQHCTSKSANMLRESAPVASRTETGLSPRQHAGARCLDTLRAGATDGVNSLP